MGSLIRSDFDDVLADAGESRGIEICLGVVCKSFFIELGFEILESQRKVKDDAVVNCLTFGDWVAQSDAGVGGKGACL